MTSKTKDSIFMLGACGMGMAPLALYLKQMGYRIFAFDDHINLPLRKMMISKGIDFLDNRKLPADVDGLVYTQAMPKNDPILEAARAKGLWLRSRGEMLAQSVSGKKVFAIAGSHGKTTTVGLISYGIFKEDKPVDYLMGGLFNAHADKDEIPLARYNPNSEWVVVELDESDGTIDHFSPAITMLLNFDWDHSSQYATPEDLMDTLMRLSQRTELSVWTHNRNRHLLQHIRCDERIKVKSFGPSGFFSVFPVTKEHTFINVSLKDVFSVMLFSPLEGSFNQENMEAAALALSFLVGCHFNPHCLYDFPGIERRQTCLFQDESLIVYEDYAHHPTEIKKVTAHLSRMHPGHSVIAIFQPHRYTRTKSLFYQFVRVLAPLPNLMLMDVYAAFEPPLPGAESKDLLQAIQSAGNRDAALFSEARLTKIISEASGPCVVLFLGAGSITKTAHQWTSSLRQPEPIVP